MKVLLVEPPISPYDIPTGILGLPEPLALETVAAGMLSRHDVTLLDMRIEPEGLESCLQRTRPQVVGVGSVTANLHLAKEILKQAKEFDPKILTLIGGHHVTFLPQDANEPFIDVAVLGEGDRSVAQVVDAFERGEPFAEIPGLSFFADGKQITTRKPALLDMDELPTPARSLVSGYRQRYFQRAYRPIVSINTSRGCVNRCSFCSLWKMNQGKYRTRSAERVVDEIAERPEEFIDFIDDNSLENIERSHAIADLMIQKGLKKKMKMYGCADTVASHPEMIQRLAEAGLEMLLVGFESVRSDKLGDWNKRSNLDKNQKAIEVLQRAGVKIISYFVIDPNFEESDFEDLWKYVSQMELLDPIFTVLVPFPGTDLFEETKSDIRYRDYRLFDFFHTVFETKLPLKRFYEQFTWLYEKTYEKMRKMAHAGPALPPAMVEAQAKAFQEIFRRLRSLPEHHELPTSFGPPQ
jgi:hopanoid C-3 methylase